MVAAALAVLFLLAPVHAQNSRPDNTPILIQDGFGPFGEYLPNDGLEYCCPTATTMGLYWLGSNGYTMLAPASYDPNNPADVAAALNIDRAIAGLFNTSPGVGTKGGAVQGIQTYFGLKGLSSNSSVVGQSFPTPVEIGASLSGFQFSVLSVGWYHTNNPNEWVKKGGHCLALVDYVPGSPNGTVTIHNPMSATPQTPMVLEITDAPPANASLNGNYQLQQGILSTPGVVPVLQGMFTFDPGPLPAPGVYYDFDISAGGGISIDTNGATLTAPARLVGTGSLTKGGAGTLALETSLAGGNTFSGGLIVNEGTLLTSQNSGTPVGSGNVSLGGGTIAFAPTGTGSSLALNVSGAGSTFAYSGGTLAISKGGYGELTVVLGGNTDGVTPNMIRNWRGSLILAASGGLSSLGASEKLVVNGTAANLPPVLNGIVDPAIFGQDNDSDLSADFLTYAPADGFARFTGYVSSNVTALGPANTNDTTVYANVTNQSLSANASVYALKITDSTISDGAGTELKVGPGPGATDAGVILNGGSIATSALDFGSNTAVVYVNKAGGTISSRIQGSAGLVVTGPGTLLLTGANDYTGGTTVTSGTLVVSGTSGNGTVNVQYEGTLGGAGTVGGALNLYGAISPGNSLHAAGTLTIDGKATFLDGSDFQWDLTALKDSQSGVAGTDWDFLQINGDLYLPSLTENLFAQITLQFDAIAGPNSGNPFWAVNHSWEIAAVTGAISNFSASGTSLDISNPRWADGRFALAPNSAGDQILLIYTIPEPSTMALAALAGLLLLFTIGRRGSARHGLRE